jgi:prephenate dehydrogenase
MSLDPAQARDLGVVRVVGTGLLGTSVALGLRSCGVTVVLHDPSPTALALAADVGAGERDHGALPVGLVVVAAPPDVTASVVAEELKRHPEAVVTDVASVKAGIVRELLAAGVSLERYVGSHPMAGRERSGPIAARDDLFIGRPWVICPSDERTVSSAGKVAVVRRLATALGASPLVMSPTDHDAAVALVSHVPQLAASLVAARLREAPEGMVELAGQGLRDVTRIAASDPSLWAQILGANAEPVRAVLADLRSDLDDVLAALAAISGNEEPGAAPSAGSRGVLAQTVAAGNAGHARIPGKHGAAPTTYAVVTALLPDRPGQLARLFADIGEAGINVEEFSLEHASGQLVGLASVSVLPAARESLEHALSARGWHVVA